MTAGRPRVLQSGVKKRKAGRISFETRKVNHNKSTAWLDEYGIKNPGMRLFLITYEKIGTVTGACRELGYGSVKIYNWVAGYTTSFGKKNAPTPEGENFKRAMDEAKLRHFELLEMEAEKRAMRGSDNLLLKLLSAGDPAKYRESWAKSAAESASRLPAVQVQVNQLVQSAMQDPSKLEEVVKLAVKLGLEARLLAAPEDKAALPAPPEREVVPEATETVVVEKDASRGSTES